MPVQPLHNAYLLHQRPYRESSSIVDIFSSQHGHVRAVCKGIVGSGKAASRLRATLQPFSELSLIWSGKSELKTLRQAEAITAPATLSGQTLYAALYLNELLLRLLRVDEPSISLYEGYKKTLTSLASISAGEAGEQQKNMEEALRLFEFALLESMGFGLDTACEANSHAAIEASKYYSLDVDRGFIESAKSQGENSLHSIPGRIIKNLEDRLFDDQDVLRYAKLITRAALAPHLGGKPLKTRELYK